MFRHAIIIGVIGIVGASAGYGRDALELESHYAGNGRFDYHLRTLDDPFLTGITFSSLFPSPFTNYLDNTLPPDWTNAFRNGAWAGIRFDNSVSQPRINEVSFSVRSSFTHFRRQPHGFGTILGLTFFDPDYYGGGIGGYVNFDCLVPCAPEEADGSPDTLIWPVELIHDVKIDALIVTNQEIHGLTFSWDQSSTVQFEGSHDLTDWTPIARFFGDPPRSTWTTNVPLNSLGEFFRLSLLATRHVTNLVATTSLTSESQNLPASVAPGERPAGDQSRTGLISAPNPP